MTTLFVTLSSCGNPDYGQDPEQCLPGVPTVSCPVQNYAEASRACQDYITQHNLGSGNWCGGKVTDSLHKELARVSYNGKVWTLEKEPQLLYEPGQEKRSYHLLNDFGIYKDRIRSCIPENDDDPDNEKGLRLLAERRQLYTVEELELLFGWLWTSHDECVVENSYDYHPIQVHTANKKIESGEEAWDKLKRIKGEALFRS